MIIVCIVPLAWAAFIFAATLLESNDGRTNRDSRHVP